MRYSQRIVHTAFVGAAAAALLVAPSAVQAGETPARVDARPCYDGFVVGNPYVRSCSLPGRGHKIRGSAPDANAIIACRDIPGCLSNYVNGPW